jgi:hypothetical protein
MHRNTEHQWDSHISILRPDIFRPWRESRKWNRNY